MTDETDIEPTHEYEPCIVTFIDVLGFRDMLDKRSAADIARVLELMSEYAAPLPPRHRTASRKQG